MSEKNSVLIIDDDPIIRSLARKILERAGFDTVLAASGEEGLALLEEDPGAYDLVITDYSLDGLSGVDLVYAIRSQAPATPVILSSGEQIELEDLPADLQSHMYILQKPYRSRQLTDLVETALVESALVID